MSIAHHSGSLQWINKQSQLRRSAGGVRNLSDWSVYVFMYVLAQKRNLSASALRHRDVILANAAGPGVVVALRPKILRNLTVTAHINCVLTFPFDTD